MPIPNDCTLFQVKIANLNYGLEQRFEGIGDN